MTIKRNYKKRISRAVTKGRQQKTDRKTTARRLLDKIGVDKNKNGKADKRKAKT